MRHDLQTNEPSRHCLKSLAVRSRAAELATYNDPAKRNFSRGADFAREARSPFFFWLEGEVPT